MELCIKIEKTACFLVGNHPTMECDSERTDYLNGLNFVYQECSYASG